MSSRYFTQAQWIEKLRGLPREGAILDSGSLRLLARLDERAGRQALWRLNRAGIVRHLGGGLYTHAFAQPSVDELGNVAVRPSYVSLDTVLSRTGVTTQRSVFHTCVTLQPTQVRESPLGRIEYHHIARDLFWGFEIRRGPSGLAYFEAGPEKALLDYVYLGRRAGRPVYIDLDFGALDEKRLAEYALRFPATVQREIDELRRTHVVVS